MSERAKMPSADLSTIGETEQALNGLILTGRIMDGYERFYADNVAMQENTVEPCYGKDANRERQGQFFGFVQEIHSIRLLGSAVCGDRAYSEWEYDISFKDGFRYTLAEVSVRQWADGQVVSERFYWDRSNYPYEV